MPHPIAYLGFDGNCAEAMRFYERALGGKLEALMTNGASPSHALCNSIASWLQYLALVIDKWMAYKVLDARSIVLWALDADRADLVGWYDRNRQCSL